MIAGSPLSFFSTLPHLGVGEKLLLIAFLVAGLIFFYLSFTARHGRSRWPLHGIMALIVGAAYGIPILYVTAAKGLTFPKEAVDSMGVAMSNVLYPSYSLKLVLGTTLLVFVTVTIVSFMPARKIVKLRPTDALRGKLS